MNEAHNESSQEKRIEQLILASAKQYPKNTAIAEWNNQSWQEITYENLIARAKTFATQLSHCNIIAGERIILMSHNQIQAVVALIGIWLLNATAVLIDPELPDSVKEEQCNIADARCAIVEDEKYILSYHEYFIVIYDEHFDFKKNEGTVSKTVYQDCSADIATIVFTSGTTGNYKAVMLSHHNFIYLKKYFEFLFLKQESVLSIFPLFHVSGLFCSIVEPLWYSAKIILFRTFSANALQEGFSNYHPDVLMCVPRVLELLDQKIQSRVNERGKSAKIFFSISTKIAYVLSRYLKITVGKLLFKSIHEKLGARLNFIICGAAALSFELQHRFLTYGFQLLCGYGLTETCGPIVVEMDHTKRWKLGNSGACINSKDLKINDQGEILYGGEALMLGYFRDEDATNTAITNGYFHTRDLGQLDRDHRLFIVGRIKELIIFSDGKKAMPLQIEKQYAVISGIKEFAIFGVLKNTMIAVLAFVPIDKENTTTIKADILRVASKLKSPFRVQDILMVDQLPRSNTQKIKRYELENIYLSKFQRSKNLNHLSTDNLQLENIIACFKSVLPPSQKITADMSFAELNIDSLLAMQLCERLHANLALDIEPTAFWFFNSIRELSEHLPMQKKLPIQHQNIAAIEDAIAIIAVSCQFPKSNDVNGFWKNMLEGNDLITEVPLSRWNRDEYYDPYPLALGKTNSKWGGFIDLPVDFQAEKFGIKPRLASMIDPQQKILLILTQQLLGNTAEKFFHTKTGVFIGSGFPEFMMNMLQHIQPEKINSYSGIGMEDFSLSSRIAYHFGLEGPAMVIKTACSSSLVSIHQAMRALQMRDCDAAIAGGINLMLSPIINICLTKGGFLSPDGRCKTFDATANGYVRSEGCGLVLLKRLSDAKRDNDRILGIISASAINQDGASNGITAPNGESQAACYQEALDRAHIHAHDVSFVEAHGSGTQLGDAIEMQSIQMIYDQKRNSNNPLYVGAIKSLMGHPESAAGIAGFIKTLLVLQHQIIPPNLHYHSPNPTISFKNSAVRLPTQAMSFEKPCDYAAVSSFGVAGTNVHVVLKRV